MAAADASVSITAGIGTAIACELAGGNEYQITGVRLTSPFTELPVTFNTNGANNVIAATAAKQIRLYGWILYAAGAVNMNPKEGAGTAAFGAAFPFLGQGAAWFLPLVKIAYWTLPVNTAMNLALDAGVVVSGRIWYRVD